MCEIRQSSPIKEFIHTLQQIMTVITSCAVNYFTCTNYSFIHELGPVMFIYTVCVATVNLVVICKGEFKEMGGYRLGFSLYICFTYISGRRLTDSVVIT